MNIPQDRNGGGAMSKNVQGCFACDQPVLPMKDVSLLKSDDLPLCPNHWNWWIIRWLNAEDEPPCGAHLIEPDVTE